MKGKGYLSTSSSMREKKKKQEHLILTWCSQAVVQSTGFILDHMEMVWGADSRDTLSLEILIQWIWAEFREYIFNKCPDDSDASVQTGVEYFLHSYRLLKLFASQKYDSFFLFCFIFLVVFFFFEVETFNIYKQEKEYNKPQLQGPTTVCHFASQFY